MEITPARIKYWNIPVQCPVCSGPLEVLESFLNCGNKNCKTYILQHVNKFIMTLDIKFLGDLHVTGLVMNGELKSAADVLTLDLGQFSSVERKGEKMFNKFRADLQEKIKQVPLAKFMAALNIPLAGEGIFQRITEAGYDTVEKIFDTLENNPTVLWKVDLIGESKTDAMTADAKRAKEVALAMITSGLEVIEPGNMSAADAPFKGLVFCQTGSMPGMTRTELSKHITLKGGVFKSSIGKGVTYLIAEDAGGDSSKLQKARSMGIKVITPDEFYKLSTV